MDAAFHPGENARSWEALGEARPGQSSLSAGALRYRAEEPEGGVASGGFGLRRSRHLTGTLESEAETDLSEGAWSALRQALQQGAGTRTSGLAPGQNADRRVQGAPVGPQPSSLGGAGTSFSSSLLPSTPS